MGLCLIGGGNMKTTEVIQMTDKEKFLDLFSKYFDIKTQETFILDMETVCLSIETGNTKINFSFDKNTGEFVKPFCHTSLIRQGRD